MFPPTQHSNKIVYPVLLYNHYDFASMFILALMFFLRCLVESLFNASVVVLALENAGEF